MKVASNKGGLCRNVAEDGVWPQAGVLGVGEGAALSPAAGTSTGSYSRSPHFIIIWGVVNTYLTWVVRMK